MNILNLPNVMLIQIFEFLPYEEVAKKRLICKKIDIICQHILNCGFNKVVKQHSISLKRIKALLPRRESERRNHCLARHADILTCIETRISMLSMTYSKYMDLNLCCFIPGRVLDEIFRILRLISKTTKPLRPHEVLQELRDISSMAIEHFDEKISNSLRKSFVDGNTLYSNSLSSTSGATSTVANASSSSKNICCDQMRQKVNILLGLHQTSFEPAHFSAQVPPKTSQIGLVEDNLHQDRQQQQQPQPAVPATTTSRCDGGQGCEEARTAMKYFKKMEQQYNSGFNKVNRMMRVQITQSLRLNKSMAIISLLNAQVNECKKRLEDMDAKNRELSASLKRLKGESAAAPNTPQTTTSTTTADNQEFPNSDVQTTTTTTTCSELSISPETTAKQPIEKEDIDLKSIPVKRHLDELPPPDDDIASISTSLNTPKKAKVE